MIDPLPENTPEESRYGTCVACGVHDNLWNHHCDEKKIARRDKMRATGKTCRSDSQRCEGQRLYEGLAMLQMSVLAFVMLVGCSSPAPYAPNIDEAFVQAVAMQWEFTDSTEKSAEKPSGKTSVEASGNEEYIDELPPLSDVDVRAFYTLYKPEIDKLWQKHKDWTLYDAVVTWGAIESVKRNGKPNSSAAAEGETTPAVTKGSAPPAVETPKLLFYEIILHTGKDCAPCDRLKHELKVRGYPFTEHLVSKGTVPTAFIDGEEFVGDAIYNRLKIVKLNRKDSP